MPTSTNFPQRPVRSADAGQIAWTIWNNLLWFVSIVYDQFASKFDQGSSSILGGNTTVVVTHKLGVSTFYVEITWTGDPGVTRWWVSSKTTSQFTLNLSTAPAGAVGFDWTVKAP